LCLWSQDFCESIVRERRINCFAGVAFSGGAGFVALGNIESKPRMSGLVHLAVGPLMAESEDIEFLPIVSYEPEGCTILLQSSCFKIQKNSARYFI
jgi:hypothetical protein